MFILTYTCIITFLTYKKLRTTYDTHAVVILCELGGVVQQATWLPYPSHHKSMHALRA